MNRRNTLPIVLTEAPTDFADPPASDGLPPAGDGVPHSDILSNVLRAVRLRGEKILCCAPASPFAISFDQPGGTLHVFGQGEFEMQIDGQSGTHQYRRGDIAMLPAGRRHVVRHGRNVSPRPLAPSDMPPPGSPHEEGARWLVGTFSFDDSRAAVLLHGLPAVVALRGAVDQALIWMDVSAQMLMQEITLPSQGSQEMISRILDLLFIQVLRAWATGPDATPGWLTGAMDPVVGDAITAIHANPAHPWTVERLARKSNLSRSAFADRFARRAGQSPGAYITQVRLAAAADLLLDTKASIQAVANRTGYDSEAAFSRAFSRRFGTPPSRWRREVGL